MPKEVDAIRSRNVKNSPALKAALGRLKKLLPPEMSLGVEAFIVGGSILDALVGRQGQPFAPAKDVDIFFPNEEAFEQARDSFSSHEEPFDKGDAKLVYQRPNKTSYTYRGVKFDLVSSVYCDTPEELVDLVDFTVSSGAFDLRDDHFCSHRLFFEDFSAKALRAHALPNPTKTMFRMPRYVQRGFWPDYGTLTRIGKNIESAALEREFITVPPSEEFGVQNQELVITAMKLFDWTELQEDHDAP